MAAGAPSALEHDAEVGCGSARNDLHEGAWGVWACWAYGNCSLRSASSHIMRTPTGITASLKSKCEV